MKKEGFFKLLGSNAKGFTLIELMVAIGIGSIVIFASTTILKQANSVKNMTYEMMLSVTDQSNFGKLLLNELNKSQILKSKGLKSADGCTFISTNRQGRDELQATGNIHSEKTVLDDAGEEFTIGFTKHSSIATLSDSANVVAVPDETLFPVGSLVMLSSITNSINNAVFKVTGTSTGRITLSNTLDVPKEIPCEFSLKADVLALGGGTLLRLFRIDLIQVVNYSLTRDSAGELNLTRKAWPVGADGKVHILNVMERIVSISVNSQWEPHTNYSGPEALNLGRVVNDLIINSKKSKKVDYGTERIFHGGYTLTASTRENFEVKTEATAPAPALANCAVEAKLLQSNIRVADSVTPPSSLVPSDTLWSRFVHLKVNVNHSLSSDPPLSFGEAKITIGGLSADFSECIEFENINDVLVTTNGFLTVDWTNGASNPIVPLRTLRKGGAGYPNVICKLPTEGNDMFGTLSDIDLKQSGTLNISSSITYFDPELSRQREAPCNTISLPIDPVILTTAQTPSCYDTSGTIPGAGISISFPMQPICQWDCINPAPFGSCDRDKYFSSNTFSKANCTLGGGTLSTVHLKAIQYTPTELADEYQRQNSTVTPAFPPWNGTIDCI